MPGKHLYISPETGRPAALAHAKFGHSRKFSHDGSSFTFGSFHGHHYGKNGKVRYHASTARHMHGLSEAVDSLMGGRCDTKSSWYAMTSGLPFMKKGSEQMGWQGSNNLSEFASTLDKFEFPTPMDRVNVMNAVHGALRDGANRIFSAAIRQIAGSPVFMVYRRTQMTVVIGGYPSVQFHDNMGKDYPTHAFPHGAVMAIEHDDNKVTSATVYACAPAGYSLMNEGMTRVSDTGSLTRKFTSDTREDTRPPANGFVVIDFDVRGGGKTVIANLGIHEAYVLENAAEQAFLAQVKEEPADEDAAVEAATSIEETVAAAEEAEEQAEAAGAAAADPDDDDSSSSSSSSSEDEKPKKKERPKVHTKQPYKGLRVFGLNGSPVRGLYGKETKK